MTSRSRWRCEDTDADRKGPPAGCAVHMTARVMVSKPGAPPAGEVLSRPKISDAEVGATATTG